jgi:ectoine hydroxylase-related dioxygenase (phytanoyl-CoA dioxygenase family)
MTDFAQSIADDGFAIVEDNVDSTLVAELVDAIGVVSNEVAGLRNLHERCGEARRLCVDERILKLARAVIGERAFVVRSLFFDKSPNANWKVAWHQDLSIAVSEKIETDGFGPWSVKDGVVHVQPPVEVLQRMVTLRVHLDDCGADNGPLRVLPGSHRHGRLSAEQIAEFRGRTKEVVCEVRSGGVVLMRPLILHASSPAAVPKHRRVVHLEFAAEGLPDGLRWVGRGV